MDAQHCGGDEVTFLRGDVDKDGRGAGDAVGYTCGSIPIGYSANAEDTNDGDPCIPASGSGCDR